MTFATSNQCLPNLRLNEFREIECLENELDMEVFVEPVISTTQIACPKCGSSVVTIHENDERFFRDINMYGKRVGVSVQGKRYKCKDCGKSFILTYGCIDPNDKMSKRLKRVIQEKALHNTFTAVAEEHGLSSKTVENCFNECIEILDLRPDVIAPRVLGIDECHLEKKMHAVYADIEAGKILEMGRSIKKADVIRDLMNFQDLDKVEVVTTDMCNTYRLAIQTVLPNAIHVVDKFHVVQMFMNAVDVARAIIFEDIKTRVEMISSNPVRERERAKFIDLGIDAYMFRMSPENMSDWRLERYNQIIATYPEFAQLAVLRKAFFSIYDADNVRSAESAYEIWKRSIPNTPAYVNMRHLATRTFKNWGKEIFNYFMVTGRKTNATTERLNGAIKSMQNMGRGYSFRVLRAKMLFGSEVAKKPLYRRISKPDELENGPNPGRKFDQDVTEYMRMKKISDTEAFELDPFVAGGTQELSSYYGGKDSFIPLDDPELREYARIPPGESAQWKESIPRNQQLMLLENGGADIERIIEYEHVHGECI